MTSIVCPQLDQQLKRDVGFLILNVIDDEKSPTSRADNVENLHENANARRTNTESASSTS